MSNAARASGRRLLTTRAGPELMADTTVPPITPQATSTPPDDGSVFDAFLSYNSQDHPHILAIRRRLHDRGVATFFDREGLNPGLPWQVELEASIKQSRAVAVFLGPNGLGVWQKREMAFALDRQAQGEKSGVRIPVIPVLLPGFRFDNPSQEPPSLLMLNTSVDLRAGPDNAAAIEALARAMRGETPPSPEVPAACPYRGLRPFREDDALLFFGARHSPLTSWKRRGRVPSWRSSARRAVASRRSSRPA